MMKDFILKITLILLLIFMISEYTYSKNKTRIDKVYTVKHKQDKIKIDGNLDDWDVDSKYKIILNSKNKETGDISGNDDLNGVFFFLWDRRFLYMAAEIEDNEIISDLNVKIIWMNDCIEIYIDPATTGFLWHSEEDFQLGFSPSDQKKIDKAKTWEWFHENKKIKINAVSKVKENDSYIIEAAIPWNSINIIPKKNKIFRLGIGLNDVDIQEDDTPSVKLLWGYKVLNKGIKLAGFILK